MKSTINSSEKLPSYHLATALASKRLLAPLSCFMMLVWASGIFAATPKVSVSISPVHSLVSAVMQGAGAPELLILPGHSPHVQPLSPSAVKNLYDSDLVVWIGPDLEVAMSKITGQVKPQDRVKSLLDDAGLNTLPVREHSIWGDHGHDHGHDDEDDHEEHGHEDDHGHDEEDDEHAHEDEHGHDDHEEHGHKDEHEHDDREEHGHEKHERAPVVDPHVWLSTENAIMIVSALTDWISRIDGERSDLYRSNRDQAIARIQQTKERVSQILEPVKTIPYIVFHDAWQYYEKENQLNSQTSVTHSPDQAPAIRQVQDLNQMIRERGVKCVFREPQFEPRIIPTVIEGTEARIGVLDPLGAELTPGPDMWHELMLSIATSLRTCLSGE